MTEPVSSNKILTSSSSLLENHSCAVCTQVLTREFTHPGSESGFSGQNITDKPVIISNNFDIVSINCKLPEGLSINPLDAAGNKCWEILRMSICSTDTCSLTRMRYGCPATSVECHKSLEDGPVAPCMASAFPLYCSQGHFAGIAGYFNNPDEFEHGPVKPNEPQDRYQALIELSGPVSECILMAQDIDGRQGVITFASSQFCRMTGYTREELSGRSGFDIIDPRDRQVALARHSRKMQGECLPGLYEVNIICKDGSTLSCELTSGITRYQGSPANIIYLRDITERNRAVEKLAKSEWKFKSLFEHLTIAAWEIDMSDVRQYFDQLKFQGITNLKKYLNQNPGDSLLADYPSLCKYISVNIAAFDLYEIEPGQRSRDYFKHLLHSRIKASRGAVKSQIDMLDALYSGKSSFESEAPFVKASGKPGKAWLKITVPPENLGDFSRVFCTMDDRSDLRKAQRKLQLHQASLKTQIKTRTSQLTEEIQKHRKTEEKLQLLFSREQILHREVKKQLVERARFSAVLVHELKTPLTPVVSASDYLLAYTTNEPAASFARQINQGVLRLCNRIDELLDLTKGELGILELNRSRFSITGLLRECHDVFMPLAIERNLSFNLNITADPLIVWADGERIRQVIHNLIDNAIKYTPVGGAIVIITREDKGKTFVEISNTDFSIHSDQKSLFKPYWKMPARKQRKFGSLGLGLAICKMLMNLHGEDIWFDTREGTGSVFTFSLANHTKQKQPGNVNE